MFAKPNGRAANNSVGTRIEIRGSTEDFNPDTVFLQIFGIVAELLFDQKRKQVLEPRRVGKTLGAEYSGQLRFDVVGCWGSQLLDAVHGARKFAHAVSEDFNLITAYGDISQTGKGLHLLEKTGVKQLHRSMELVMKRLTNSN